MRCIHAEAKVSHIEDVQVLITRASLGQELPTPLKQSEFAHYLIGYDKELTQYIINGISFEFDIGYTGIIANLKAQNGPSILEYFDQTKSLLQKEVDLNDISGHTIPRLSTIPIYPPYWLDPSQILQTLE